MVAAAQWRLTIVGDCVAASDATVMTQWRSARRGNCVVGELFESVLLCYVILERRKATETRETFAVLHFGGAKASFCIKSTTKSFAVINHFGVRRCPLAEWRSLHFPPTAPQYEPRAGMPLSIAIGWLSSP